jgi:cytidylate kinase
MPTDIVIAVDGPAGAGKSTVCRIVSEKLGLTLLDTGAMYRCVALKAMRLGVTNLDQIAELARNTGIVFQPGTPQRVLLDGEDVTEAIRTLEVGKRASEVSAHPPLRTVLVERQKALIKRGNCILEGRDTTTVVAPNADVKVFLTASIEERARRRWEETKTNTLQAVVKDVVVRDHRDYTRADSPLTLAEDAVIIETFGLTAEKVAEKVLKLAEAK